MSVVGQEMYSKINILLLHFILMFFKILGVAPFSMNVQSKIRKITKLTILNFTKSNIAVVYSIGLTLLVSTMFYYELIKVANIESLTGSTTVFIASSIIGHIACIMALLIHLYHQKNTITIANRLVSLQTVLGKLRYRDQQQHGKYHNLYALIYIIFMVGSYTTLCIRSIKQDELDMVTDIIAYFWVQFIAIHATIIIIQYTLVINHLQKIFASLNASFCSLAYATIELQHYSIIVTPALRNSIKCDLRMTKKVHRSLCELVAVTSDFYSWPILLSISYLFMNLTTFLYLIVLNIVDEYSTFIENIYITWSIILIITPVVLLTITIDELQAEVCKIFD